MKIKWNSESNAKHIFNVLEKNKTIHGNQYSITSFGKIEADVVLNSHLKFDKSIPIPDRPILISKAFMACLKTELTTSTFLKAINDFYSESQATSEMKFILLSTISLEPNFPIKTFATQNCRIRLLKNDYPAKFRRKKDSPLALISDKVVRPEFCKVMVEVKAKTYLQAGEECLMALNLFRGFLCFHTNSSLVYSFGVSKKESINSITLGDLHFLHLDNGKIFDRHIFWYEDNPTKEVIYKIKPGDLTTISKNFKIFQKKIKASKLSELIQESLIQFTTAMDSTDPNAAIVGGWAALEMILGNSFEGKAENVSSRCSKLWDDPEYHYSILEHIRTYRNAHVHAGLSTTEPKIICYQLQRYFRSAWKFLTFFGSEFTQISDFHEFLDHLKTPSKLDQKRIVLNKAISFLETSKKRNARSSSNNI